MTQASPSAAALTRVAPPPAYCNGVADLAQLIPEQPAEPARKLPKTQKQKRPRAA
jgi:hypothetical protein